MEAYQFSGLSGPRSASIQGVNYQTVASWLQKLKQITQSRIEALGKSSSCLATWSIPPVSRHFQKLPNLKKIAKTSKPDIIALFFVELSQQNLEEALRLLGNLLATRKGDGFWLVVYGGSALLAQKIITRSTEDVDVLAIRDWEGGVDRAYPMPEALKLAATQVADELHLGGNWLNSAASLHFPDLHMLPSSFWQELETREYGHYLKISFVTRSGQIQLKTYAALNRAKPRDLDDLRTLAPTSVETEAAVRWVLDHLPVLSHRDKLHDLLTLLGHAHLIPKFQG